MNNTTTTPQKGYKNTAIGVIPLDWEIKRLGQIGELKNGINKDKDQFGFGFPLINLNDVFEINTDHDKNFSLVNSNEKERENYSLDKGDVLFVRSSVKATGVGLTCVILNDIKDAVYSGFIIRFRDSNYLDLNYKVHCFYEQGFRNRLLAKSTISANININQVALNSLQLPVPPLPEQQKIAEILSTWDEAITITKKCVKKITKRNKGLAQQLLTSKKRLNGFNEKWGTINLGKIATRVTTKNEELDDTVVTISAQRGFVLQEDFFNKRVASDTLSGYYLIKKGQFAYNKSYSNGYPMGAFKRLNDFEKAVVTTLYICFEFKENICSDYMVHFFENGFMINNLMKVAKEGGRAHGLLNIGLEDFMNLELTIPSYKEQTAISQVLETANQELKSYQAKLETLQLQKKGLMQQLLTGKIRVNVK